jgi:hypothetical protein
MLLSYLSLSHPPTPTISPVHPQDSVCVRNKEKTTIPTPIHTYAYIHPQSPTPTSISTPSYWPTPSITHTHTHTSIFLCIENNRNLALFDVYSFSYLFFKNNNSYLHKHEIVWIFVRMFLFLPRKPGLCLVWYRGNILPTPHGLLIKVRIEKIFLVAKVENLLVPVARTWSGWANMDWSGCQVPTEKTAEIDEEEVHVLFSLVFN